RVHPPHPRPLRWKTLRHPRRRERASAPDVAEREGHLVRVVARRNANRLHRSRRVALAGAARRGRAPAAAAKVATPERGPELVSGRDQDRDRLVRGGGAAVALPAGKHVGYHLAWSPEGDLIYYDGSGGIWGIRLDGTGRRQLSPVGYVG